MLQDVKLEINKKGFTLSAKPLKFWQQRLTLIQFTAVEPSVAI